MESTLTIGKVQSSTESFSPFRPITFSTNLGMETLQDLLATEDGEQCLYDTAAETYQSMLRKAITEVTKSSTPSMCSVTLKRKHTLEVKFQNEPPGMLHNIVSTDEVTIKK